MKLGLITCFSIVVKLCSAQQLLPIQYDTTLYSHELIINGIGDFGSTSLRNDLTTKLIYGGQITDRIKDHSFSSHGEINRIGEELNTEIEYRNLKVNAFKNESIGFVIKGGYYSVGSAVYSKDLFGFGFYGNTNYLGEMSDFSGSKASYIDFQKIGFGCIDKKTKSSITLNVYNVSNLYYANINKGELLQDTSGTSITLDLLGGVTMTRGTTFTKGLGIGIDVDYRIKMEWQNSKKATIQFVAKNIGFVNYFTGLQSYSVDSTYHYEGLKINQLYGENSLFKEDFSLMDTLNVQKAIYRSNVTLPGYFQIGKIVDDNNTGRWQSFFGIRMYPTLAYNPLIFAGAHFTANKSIELGSQLSYGGFSNFRMGFYSNFRYKNWTLGIASQDLYGVISKNGFGQSLLIRIRCKID